MKKYIFRFPLILWKNKLQSLLFFLNFLPTWSKQFSVFPKSILSFCNTGTTWRSSPIVAKQPEKHHCQNSDYLGFVLVSNLKIIWFWGKCTLYKESPKMCSLSHLTGQTASRPVTLLSFSGILFTFLHCITASSGPSSNGLHTTMWCIKQMKKTLTLSDSIIKNMFSPFA